MRGEGERPMGAISMAILEQVEAENALLWDVVEAAKKWVLADPYAKWQARAAVIDALQRLDAAVPQEPLP